MIPRFIPKRLFQAIATLLLISTIGLAFYFIITDSGLFHFLYISTELPRGWAMVLTFLGVFISWGLIILPIRLFSQMPTLHEELESNQVQNISQLFDKKSTEMDRNSPAQRNRQLGIGGLVLGLITGLASLVIILVSDFIPIGTIAFSIVGFIGGGWHLLKSIRK